MEAAGDADPKLESALRYLRRERWAQRGCILFSQYLDTVTWLAEHLAQAFPAETIGVYGGQGNSFLIEEGKRRGASREEIQAKVRNRSLRLLAATDAASEGLNFQRLETLINVDLPWNPARLEQRKGRIDRLGQLAANIEILNLRYRGSVEDQVHQTLSSRLFADPRSIRDHSRHIGGRLGRDCAGGARGGSAAHRRGATATSIRPAVCARPARNRVGAVRAGFGSI
jgi:superfamily II DNA/RNA helicase